MSYRGKIHKGVVVLDRAPRLEEGTPVDVRILRSKKTSLKRGSLEAILRHAGSWSGPPGELERLLAGLKATKEAEVAAERSRLGLNRRSGSRFH